jgi:hypothetical protein
MNPEDRGQKADYRRQVSGFGCQVSEDRGQKLEIGN